MNALTHARCLAAFKPFNQIFSLYSSEIRDLVDSTTSSVHVDSWCTRRSYKVSSTTIMCLLFSFDIWSKLCYKLRALTHMIDSIERLRNKNSEYTFHPLRATIPKPIPHTLAVILPEQNPKSVPMTKETTDLLFVKYQASRFSEGQWVMVRMDLVKVMISYHDTLEENEDNENRNLRATCKSCKVFARSAMNHKHLKPVQRPFVSRREPVRHHHHSLTLGACTDSFSQVTQSSDGKNCGPVSWTYVESYLDPSNTRDCFSDSRLRHLAQIYTAVKDRGIQIPQSGNISIECGDSKKRKAESISIESYSAKILKATLTSSGKVMECKEESRAPLRSKINPTGKFSHILEQYITAWHN